MFCENCGAPIDPNAVVCMRCGFARGTGTNYCFYCGQPVCYGQAICTACGAPVQKQYFWQGQKSRLAAGLMGVFLGGLGVHNFYLGYKGKAIVQILLNVFCGAGAIWGFIEGLMILFGYINTDAYGIPLGQ